MADLVVHFLRLPDLIAELEPGTIVRVEQTKRSVPYETAGLIAMVFEIHARAYLPGEICTWLFEVGSSQYLHGCPFGDPGIEARVRNDMDRLMGQVKSLLRGSGLKVRPGLIDLGGAKPVNGSWIQPEDMQPDSSDVAGAGGVLFHDTA